MYSTGQAIYAQPIRMGANLYLGYHVQILCHSGGYERLQKAIDSLKA